MEHANETPCLAQSARFLAASSRRDHRSRVETMSPRMTRPNSPSRARPYLPGLQGCALADLKPLLAAHQHADVYNLMGLSCASPAIRAGPTTYYLQAARLIDPNKKKTRVLSNNPASCSEPAQIDKRRARMSCCPKKRCASDCEELADLESQSHTRRRKRTERRWAVASPRAAASLLAPASL